MNPIYKFILRGQEQTKTTYTQADMTRGYYDLKQGVGSIVNNEVLSAPLQIYCLRLKIKAGDKIKLGTRGYVSSSLYPYALTDTDSRIYFLPDLDLVTIDVPLTIEVEQDGYIYINYAYAPSEEFIAELTQYDNRECSPIYKDDLTKDYELESSQQFFRVKLSNKITFIRDDYDWLDAQAFDTQFILFVNESFDGGKTWKNFVKGKFMKTDCTWNVDNKSCEVSTDIYDQYNDVMNGYEKEYDVIKLAPEMKRLSIVKRPLIQVYLPGDDVVTCFMSGVYWEQDVVESTEDTDKLTNTYYFGLASQIRIVTIDATDTNVPEIAGRYVGKGNRYDKETGDFYIQYDGSHATTFPPNENNYKAAFVIYRTSNNEALYYSNNRITDEVIQKDDTFTREPATSYTGTPTASVTKYDVYMRWLVEKDSVFGVDTKPIPAEDILDDNRNYRHVVRYTSDYFELSFNSSTEPTEYGLNDDNEYYAPPTDVSGLRRYYPISKSNWAEASIWLKMGAAGDPYESEGYSPWTLKDTYTLNSVIQVLLNQFSDIRHEGTEEYSQFFYSGQNPVSKDEFTILLTPKSNLLHGNYSQAAQKAKTTLKNIMDALKNMFQCYWFIEDGKFKIEHISYFKNGGTYSGTVLGIGADLTNLENVRNNKKWGYLTSNYEFDKSEMPARYQFSWMDDVTSVFEGEPIEIRSKFVTEDNIEDVSVSNITTDVDYMLLNPSAISEDGFAMFAAVYNELLEYVATTFAKDGYYNAEGKEVYNANGDGKGWRHLLFTLVVPGTSYKVTNSSGTQINSFLWNFFTADGTHIGQSSSNSGYITLPDNCYRLGMSWRAQQDASPTTVNVVSTSEIYSVKAQQLGLPFISRIIDGTAFKLQNGYLSWVLLQPNYWTYDLPAKAVTINKQNYTLSHVSRKKKQKVKFPTLDELDTSKLVKTPLGNGQIEKISVNLSSRMNEVTLKYDTE